MNPDDLIRAKRLLLENLTGKGITDGRVLMAIEQTPREWFMPEAPLERVYDDKPFSIGEGQTISQPYTVAYQTQLLRVEPGMRVLEIGTGSGYQAAILAHMGAIVFTIERHEALFNRLSHSTYFTSLRQVHRFLGDGYGGLPQHAPFDRILVTAAAPVTPPILLDQLKTGCILVLPRNHAQLQHMVRITRRSDDDFYEELFGYFSFVPMTEGIQRSE